MTEEKKMSRVQKKKNARKKGNKPTKPGKKLAKRLLKFSLFFIGLLLVAGIGLFAYYASSAPELTEEDLLGTFSSELLDDQGVPFYTLGSENREFVKTEEIPQVLKDAIISIEDQRFYTHIGVDPVRLAGAVLANITDGFGSEGGSTLTQQLVKLSVFSHKKEDQTIKRKAQEAWLALKLERQLSKEQILSLYINKVYLSNNVYGMGTASEYYYGKNISELSLHEAALLAGMPQSPNNYNPYTNPEKAKKRRDRVLFMMVDHNVLSQEEADKTIALPITEGLVDHSGEEQDNLVFDAYLKQVLKEVKEKTGLDPFTSGLTIHTNIDMDAQKRMFDILNSEDYIAFPDERIQAGMSMVDVQTGQVKALGGGRNQDVQLGTNRATELDRSIGSVMKPLSVYAPAMEYLQYSTYEQVVDEPYQYPNGDALTNYDRQYKGQLSIREALVDSRNIPAVKTLKEVGLDQSEEFLSKLGITDLNGGKGLLWSNAIGGEVSPMNLSAAYAAFGNNGKYTEPYTVSKIITVDDQEINLKPTASQAMSEATAYMMTDILIDVAKSNAKHVGISGLTQAGKTGTTNYTSKQRKEHNIPDGGVPDSWYSGYTTNYSLSVWVGYDKQFEKDSWLSFDNGKRILPRQIYQKMMAYASESVENTDWVRPSNVVEVAVEKGTDPAMLPGPNTPNNAIVTELFVKGTEPTKSSTQYGEALSAPTGLTADYNLEKDELQITWDAYQFDSENQEEAIQYLVNVNGQSFTTAETVYTLPSPPVGTLTVSVSVQAFGKTGPEATLSIEIVGPPVEEEEDEVEEKPEPDSTQDSPPENTIEDDKEKDTSKKDTTEKPESDNSEKTSAD